MAVGEEVSGQWCRRCSETVGEIAMKNSSCRIIIVSFIDSAVVV